MKLWNGFSWRLLLIAMIASSLIASPMGTGSSAAVARHTASYSRNGRLAYLDDYQLRGISCSNDKHCIAVGIYVGSSTARVASNESGLILLTGDGGTSWNSQLTGTNVVWWGIDCPDSSRCIAVGNTNSILITSTGGVSWHSSEPSDTNYHGSLGVTCPDSNRCVAVGGPGTIVVSNDGGESWQSQFSGTNANLYGISCTNSSHCVAVGDAGTILATSDGGASWHRQRSGTNYRLNSISCPSRRRCVAVGEYLDINKVTAHANISDIDHGIILTTNNGGASWQHHSSDVFAQPNTAVQLKSIGCPSTNRCIGVGSFGSILATDDGGASWHRQPSGTLGDLTGISCPTSMECFVSGGNSDIHTTTNGGVSWAIQNL